MRNSILKENGSNNIIELYQTIISWINGISDNFEVSKDIKKYLEDFKQIIQLKLIN